MKPEKIKVWIIESERGWGQRVDQQIFFDTYEQAIAFCREYNAQNKEDSAPDWYMYARIADLPNR